MSSSLNLTLSPRSTVEGGTVIASASVGPRVLTQCVSVRGRERGKEIKGSWHGIVQGLGHTPVPPKARAQRASWPPDLAY